MTSALRTLALATLFIGNITFLAADAAEQSAALYKILQDIKTLNKQAPLTSQLKELDSGKNFTEEELSVLCENAIKKLSDFDDIVESTKYDALQKLSKDIVKQLKDFKVSGVAFANHFSGSFFYGPQDFNADIIFKNSSGKAQSKKMNFKYSSIGIQAQIAYRFDMIFAVGADLSLYSTSNPIEFGTGFVGWLGPWVIAPGVTILPIKNGPGSLIIIHCALGWSSLFALGVVHAGGTMTPQATK